MPDRNFRETREYGEIITLLAGIKECMEGIKTDNGRQWQAIRNTRDELKSFKTKVYVTATAIGATTGLGANYLLNFLGM